MVHLEPVVDGEEVVSVVVDDCSAEDDAIVQSETADVVDVVSVQSPQVHETVFGCWQEAARAREELADPADVSGHFRQ